ncbi:MAG: methyltransferase domain-containing protein [Gammaproteobacteria bacterium]|nr:methyltransferase domain-containing protein [Gammaproteobacteria bacterium]
MERRKVLTAKMEPFDSFWEGPENVEKGYSKFYAFYKDNYLKFIPNDKSSRILVVSCGPGYFVNMLNKEGYSNVVGIDSFEDKIEFAKSKGLNCIAATVFEYLEDCNETFDVIFCEQELNHMTKDEILEFLPLCRQKMNQGGVLIAHALNGANPITGAEALAQNFDHYNTFTEYTMKQVMEYSDFKEAKVFPLNLYVFWKNPLNYVLYLAAGFYTLFFRVSFIMYGKSNKIFTKKIGMACKKI